MAHEFVMNLFYHDLELRSSSFTFGKATGRRASGNGTRASSVLLSLNHDLVSVVDIDTLRAGLAHDAATVKRVPRIVVHRPLARLG